MGYGGPRYEFADEVPVAPVTPSTQPPTWFYPRGTVALINNGPGTNGSQFVLVTRDSVSGDQSEPIGTIVGGLDVVDTVVAAGDDGASVSGLDGGSPVLTTVIRTATVTFG